MKKQTPAAITNLNNYLNSQQIQNLNLNSIALIPDIYIPGSGSIDWFQKAKQINSIIGCRAWMILLYLSIAIGIDQLMYISVDGSLMERVLMKSLIVSMLLLRFLNSSWVESRVRWIIDRAYAARSWIVLRLTDRYWYQCLANILDCRSMPRLYFGNGSSSSEWGR